MTRDILRVFQEHCKKAEKHLLDGPEHEVLRGLDIEADDLALMYLAATTRLELEDFETTIDICRGIELLAPNHEHAPSVRGLAHHCLGQLDEAEKAYTKAIELNGKDQEAHLYLGELLCFERDDEENGIRHISAAKALDPCSIVGKRATVMLEIIESGQGRKPRGKTPETKR
ncbi:tetratricopeptide repeat protein [Myxococcota bacterium]